MLIAFNISLKSREVPKNNEYKITYPKEALKPEIKQETKRVDINTISKKDLASLKKEHRHKLEGLDDDEIRLRLSQIYDLENKK
jgi:hypothetical protein